MTKYICKIHGPSGFIESCEHVRDLIISRNSTEIFTIKALIYSMVVCNDCIKQYNLHKYVLDPNKEYNIFGKRSELESETFLNNYKDAYEKMKNRIGWCVNCYNELLDQHKIKT